MNTTMNIAHTLSANGLRFGWEITPETPHLFTLPVTPCIADQWLEHYKYPHQRRIREEHVDRLAQEITLGRFEGNIVDFRIFDGAPYIVNANHTLHAIIKANMPQVLTIEVKHAMSYAEVEAAYSRWDRGLPRTHRDCTPMERLMAEYNLLASDVNVIAACAPFVLSGFVAREFKKRHADWKSVETRVSFVESWGDIGRQYFDSVAQCKPEFRKPLRRAGVAAVGLVTIKHGGQQAVDFWGDVAKDEGDTSDFPTRRLGRLMLTNTYTSGQGLEYCRRVVRCWNAYATGKESIGLTRLGTRAIRIEQTPYTID